MKYLSFLIYFFFLNLSYGQAPDLEWQHSYGGTETDLGSSIKLTPDGGYIILGQTESDNGDVSDNHGAKDLWVVKMDAMGTIIWEKSLGGTAEEYSASIQLTTDGGYIIVGRTNSLNGDVTGLHGTSPDIWVVKLAVDGTIVWQKALGGTATDTGREIHQTPDGGYIVIGTSASNNGNVTGNHGLTDVWVAKLDADGNVVWQKSYGGSLEETAGGITVTSDGGYIFTAETKSSNGNVTSNHGLLDIWVVKINQTGTIQWQKTIGGTSNDSGRRIIESSDGGYLLVGHSASSNGDLTFNQGDYDLCIIGLNSGGTIEWIKSYGGSGEDVATRVIELSEGGYLVTGKISIDDGDFPGNSILDGVAIRIDTAGDILWKQLFGDDGDDFIQEARQTPDGGYILTGWNYLFDDNTNGGTDVWIIKLAPDTLDVTNPEGSKVLVYPNPVSSVLNISGLEDGVMDSATVFDYSGRKIFSVTKPLSKINVESLASGAYILEVIYDGKREKIKFIKL